MSKKPQHSYEFGPFSLDVGERLLRRDGVDVELTPSVFDTLVVLVERRGERVGKGELMDALWPESHVQEGSLTNNISTLRKTLGKMPDGESYIETIPKHGYRFVASVTERLDAGADDEAPLVVEHHSYTHIVTNEAEVKEMLDAASTPQTRVITPLHSSVPAISAVSAAVAAPPRLLRIPILLKIGIVAAVFILLLALPATLYRPTASRGTERDSKAVAPGKSTLRSIAVLPFKTIGVQERAEGEYLGIGMSDALITGLGNSRQVVVRPTSAVRRYADPLQDPLAAGREQGVEAVLDGSVQRMGDRIRVTVQLFRAEDGATLWAAKFDERFTDIFAVQDSISQEVMRELMIELSPDERKRLEGRGSKSIEAYQAYLKGLYFWNKRTRGGYQKAVGYFNQAVEADPAYAEAYVGLGNAYAYLGGHDEVAQAKAIAEQRAGTMKALELDDTLPEAHATLGLIAMNDDHDWPKAERELKRAIELNPNYATAHQWYGEFLAWMGRFDEGIAESKRARELDPLSLTISTDLAKVYMLARRYDEAIAQYRSALELDPDFEVARGLLALTYSKKGQHAEALRELRRIRNLETDPMYLSFLVYVYGEAGMKQEAQQTLRRLTDLAKRSYVSPQWMTIAYAGLGEREQAFKWFDRIFETRAQGIITVKVSPQWDNLRSDPRFPAALRSAGF